MRSALSNTRTRIISKDVDDPALRETFDAKFDTMDFGRRIRTDEWLKPAIVELQKGAQTYHVGNALFFAASSDGQMTDTNCFLIENDGQFTPIAITAYASRAGQLIVSNKVELASSQGTFTLNENTDIFNMYDIRFQLRHNAPAKKLIDDFLLPDKADRDYYRIYQASRIYREKQQEKRIEMAATYSAMSR